MGNKNKSHKDNYKPNLGVKGKICSDSCEDCLAIGEGDFICDATDELVISNWTPIKGICDVTDFAEGE